MEDFSLDLPVLRHKIRFIGISLLQDLSVDGMDTEDLAAAGGLLLDIAEDLRKINDALYPEKEEG
jgi:hypothetical protein